MALRRSGNVQWPFHMEVIAPVIGAMQLVGIEEASALTVADEGVVLETVPERLHDLHVLACPAVAKGMRMLDLEVEVPGRRFRRRGYDVPARATSGDQVQRSEFPRQVVGFLVGGGRGGNEAEVLRQRCECGKQGDGLESRDLRVTAFRASAETD